MEAAATEALDLKQGIRGSVSGPLVGEHLTNRAADEQAQDLTFGDRSGVEGAAALTVAQNRNSVGDAFHLWKTVGNVDDRGPAVGDLANLGHQQITFEPCERLCRLVEDQHFGVRRECLGDLHQLAGRRAQITYTGAGIDVGTKRR